MITANFATGSVVICVTVAALVHTHWNESEDKKYVLLLLALEFTEALHRPGVLLRDSLCGQCELRAKAQNHGSQPEPSFYVLRLQVCNTANLKQFSIGSITWKLSSLTTVPSKIFEHYATLHVSSSSLKLTADSLS